jgi:hypothetical protein
MPGIFKQFLGSERYTTLEDPEILRDTEKAIQIKWNEQKVWLPKSQITIRQKDGELLSITIPDWLFNKKFA